MISEGVKAGLTATGHGVIEMLERADFHLSDHWTDEREWFGVYLATAW